MLLSPDLSNTLILFGELAERCVDLLIGILDIIKIKNHLSEQAESIHNCDIEFDRFSFCHQDHGFKYELKRDGCALENAKKRTNNLLNHFKVATKFDESKEILGISRQFEKTIKVFELKLDSLKNKKPSIQGSDQRQMIEQIKMFLSAFEKDAKLVICYSSKQINATDNFRFVAPLIDMIDLLEGSVGTLEAVVAKLTEIDGFVNQKKRETTEQSINPMSREEVMKINAELNRSAAELEDYQRRRSSSSTSTARTKSELKNADSTYQEIKSYQLKRDDQNFDEQGRKSAKNVPADVKQESITTENSDIDKIKKNEQKEGQLKIEKQQTGRKISRIRRKKRKSRPTLKGSDLWR
ncbi:hypothetical protein ACOME3_000867 [Neoechinorhynchus agilis]